MLDCEIPKMEIRLHRNATTTIGIRQVIKESNLSAYALAKKYGISQTTAQRWKKRERVEDMSSCPHKLRTTLTETEEELICFERKQFKKTIEDICFTLQGESKQPLSDEDIQMSLPAWIRSFTGGICKGRKRDKEVQEVWSGVCSHRPFIWAKDKQRAELYFHWDRQGK